MQSQAMIKYLRLSPQKCRLVADQLRSLPVERALDLLNFSEKKAAAPLKKVLNSAIANAEHNQGADVDELWISDIQVNQAPVLKRLRARAKGRANRILKRGCHVVVRLSDAPRPRTGKSAK